MAVTVTKSTRTGYIVLSSLNSTLTTAISEVINELETLSPSSNNVDFELTYDGANFAFVAIIKRGAGAPYS